MSTRNAQAQWNGGVPDGSGEVSLGSGLFKGPYGFQSRMGDGSGGTNPEELLGAAHAACFSMALALALGQAGHVPDSVETKARVHLEKDGHAYAITRIELATAVAVSGIEEEAFQKIANDAKTNCPVSKALAGVEIRLDATLT
ncbi:MAG: OsmC family protein [Rhodanobacteraceae bacterium]